jgi:CheY-like chemotaxis protein
MKAPVAAKTASRGTAVAPTVLMVDDEPMMLRSLEREFRRSPCQVLTAAGPIEALRILGSRLVHVLITDHRMPQMTGSDLIRKASELQPGIRSVVLSATPDEARKHIGETTPVLPKPWSRSELFRLVFGATPQELSRALQPPSPAPVPVRVNDLGRR